MTTQPTAIVMFGGGALYQGMWKYVCTAAQASIVWQAVQKVIPNAQLFDDSADLAGGLPLVYLDQVTRLWGIKGTDTAGNQILESAAWLFDRMTYPNPFVDGAGGPNIHSTPIPGTGLAQLSWGS